MTVRRRQMMRMMGLSILCRQTSKKRRKHYSIMKHQYLQIKAIKRSPLLL
jgi:hypothetical protein